jgi:hypothetical protein
MPRRGKIAEPRAERCGIAFTVKPKALAGPQQVMVCPRRAVRI